MGEKTAGNTNLSGSGKDGEQLRHEEALKYTRELLGQLLGIGDRDSRAEDEEEI